MLNRPEGDAAPFSPEPFQGKFSGNDFSRASWKSHEIHSDEITRTLFNRISFLGSQE